MKYILFENDDFDSFYPMNRLLATAQLKCGFFSFLQRLNIMRTGSEIYLALPQERQLSADEAYKPFNQENIHGDLLFIHASALIRTEDLAAAENSPPGIWYSGEEIIMARLEASDAAGWIGNSFTDGYKFPAKLKKMRTGSRRLNYPWELLQYNQDQMRRDSQLLEFGKDEPIQKAHVMIFGEYPFYAAQTDLIEPGTVIDTRQGPVYLQDNVGLGAGSVLQGPLIMEKGSLSAANTVLRPGTHIGPYCKVGGEISNSIIQGFSNKSHEGFLGASYVGRWCNFGAGTNVSNLKNNYSSIRVWNRGEMTDTGLQFQGVLMGDHCKTAINTRLNTGTVADTGANIFTADFPPKYIPPFSWGGAVDSAVTRLDKFFESAEAVMSRRRKALSEPEKRALTKLYESFSHRASGRLE